MRVEVGCSAELDNGIDGRLLTRMLVAGAFPGAAAIFMLLLLMIKGH